MSESWKRMVLRSMPSPAWLSADAPDGDVVLSSRVRIMRNLQGEPFVHKATPEQLQHVQERIVDAATATDLELEAFKSLTNAERDYLVGCRLVSPDFEWTLPGRALLVDSDRMLSMMINEEDHIRAQALTAGLSIESAHVVASRVISRLGETIPFAFSPDYGYLSASYINLGAGKRMSAMFHLIGLAQVRRLPAVIKALNQRGIVVRGLFGESSRAIGAFAQISILGASNDDFTGACEYLLTEERQARRTVGLEKLSQKANQARDYVLGTRMLGLADALRVLAWIRWAASSSLEGFSIKARDIDAALTGLEIRPAGQEEFAARQRADFVRNAIG